MKPFQSKGRSQYGAGMGRADTGEATDQAVVLVHERMKWVDGDYDEGGAYWGGGSDVGHMYCFWTEDQEVVRYVRSSSAAAAIKTLTADFPNAAFTPYTPPLDEQLAPFTEAYIEAALFCGAEPPEGHELSGWDNIYPPELDEKQLAPELRERMERDARSFLEANRELLFREGALLKECAGGAAAKAGYDFWLTQQHHGAGFWDGDWREPEATQLTEAGQKYAEYSLYFGDDGKVHGA